MATCGTTRYHNTNADCKTGQRKTLSKPRIHPLQASRLIVIRDSCKPDIMYAATWEAAFKMKTQYFVRLFIKLWQPHWIKFKQLAADSIFYCNLRMSNIPLQHKVSSFSNKLENQEGKGGKKKITVTSPCKSSRIAYKNNSILSYMTLCKSVNASYKHYTTTLSMTQQGNLDIWRKFTYISKRKGFKKKKKSQQLQQCHKKWSKMTRVCAPCMFKHTKLD